MDLNRYFHSGLSWSGRNDTEIALHIPQSFKIGESPPDAV